MIENNVRQLDKLGKRYHALTQQKNAADAASAALMTAEQSRVKVAMDQLAERLGGSNRRPAAIVEETLARTTDVFATVLRARSQIWHSVS